MSSAHADAGLNASWCQCCRQQRPTVGSARNLPEGNTPGRRGCGWSRRCLSRVSLALLIDVFLRTLLTTSIVFTATQLGVSLVLVIRAFSTGIDYAFLPSLTVGVFVPVFLLVLTLVVTIVLRVKSLSIHNKLYLYGTLNVVVLASNAGVIYSCIMLHHVSLLAYELGKESSLTLAPGSVQASLNDYTLAVFQACCYFRGWAKFPIGSCSELQCTYAEFEPLCSCYVSATDWAARLLAINAFTCLDIEAFSETTLLGPPRGGGCGGGANGSLTTTGLPNVFQSDMARDLMLGSVRPLYVVLLLLAGIWIAVLLFADYLMVREWWRLRQKKRNRDRRRYELIRKRLDTTRLNVLGDKSSQRAHYPPRQTRFAGGATELEAGEGAGTGADTGAAAGWAPGQGLGLGPTRPPGSPHEPISPSNTSPRQSEIALV
jgi:hypothetical protein